jgi:hypothetical protein
LPPISGGPAKGGLTSNSVCKHSQLIRTLASPSSSIPLSSNISFTYSPSMARLPPWDTYQQELSKQDYGLPLWEGDPYGDANEIEIGDVGYVSCVHSESVILIPALLSIHSEGKFHRIFNVMHGDTRINRDEVTESHPVANVTDTRPANARPPYPNCFGVPLGHVPFVLPDIWRDPSHVLSGVIHSSGTFSSSRSGGGEVDAHSCVLTYFSG